MRSWQVERRERTRHLIELSGLVVKSGVVDLTGDDRAVILGALIWMADKLRNDERQKALGIWAERGKTAFAVCGGAFSRRVQQAAGAAGPGVTDGGRRGDLRYRSAARHRAACRVNTASSIRPSLRGSGYLPRYRT